MEFTKPRATFEETLEFANAVRRAGGGAVLDALMPAVPQEPKACLIAKNLNFNCTVDGKYDTDDWYMYFEENESLRDRIADALGLEKGDELNSTLGDRIFWVKLPPEIGQVAYDFDEAGNILGGIIYEKQEFGDNADFEGYSDEEIAMVEAMAPYIEASIAEAKELGVINAQGKLVL